MTCLAGPSYYTPSTERQHDITKSGDLDNLTAAMRSWDLHDSASVVSDASLASDHSCPSPQPKEQLKQCLHQYKSLVQPILDPSGAKTAAFWCCLGLGIATSSLPRSPPAFHSPLLAESRTDSNGSIATVSDSGFAPSVEIRSRHPMSIADPRIERTLTNLGAGLAGLFISRSLDLVDATCGVSAEVGCEFDGTLATLGLDKRQKVDVVVLAGKISTKLLNLIQSELENPHLPMVSYWELCLKLVEASAQGDVPTAIGFTTELEKRTPPPSLTEPTLSILFRSRETTDGVPFLNSKPVRTSHRMLRQTRSRAASLMSHSSLCSFSSVRSLGNLSLKSPATLSISRGFTLSHSPTNELSPTGSFVVGAGVGRGSMDYLSRALWNYSSRLGLDTGYATVASDSPLRSTGPTFSRCTSSESDPVNSNNKGKGRASEEGLRPGAEGVSTRTGTRFVMTCPPTPSGRSSLKPLPKLDPVLAALEKGSKLKSKSTCLNCGEKGSNYPCCPRCGEAWCSRECRIEANNGGKHVCKRATSTLAPLERSI